MSDRESTRAQKEALRATRADNAGERGRAYEDALARYLRLNANPPARRRAKEPEQPTTESESE